MSLILSLSLLHSSFAPVLTLLLLRTRSLIFFSLSLRYANCARNASRLSTNCKWQGLIRFVSQCLGHFTLPTSVTRCVRVWNFFILSILFIFFFYFLPLSLSLSFVSFSHYAFGCVDTLCSFWRDQRSFLSSRRVAFSSRSSWLVCDFIPSHLLFLFRYLSSEVRCASLRIVMPPLLNRPSVGYVLRVQCVFDVETQVVTMVSFCCYFAIDVLWHSATRNRLSLYRRKKVRAHAAKRSLSSCRRIAQSSRVNSINIISSWDL